MSYLLDEALSGYAVRESQILEATVFSFMFEEVVALTVFFW